MDFSVYCEETGSYIPACMANSYEKYKKLRLSKSIIENPDSYKVLRQFTNIQKIDIPDIVNQKINLPQEVALLQKLSRFSLDNTINLFSLNKNINTYVYEDNMMILISDYCEVREINKTFSNISPTIKKLNIFHFSTSVFPYDYDYINIPSTIENLNINCLDLIKFKQTNLPSSLKSITVNIVRPHETLKEEEFNKLIKRNIKIPYDCIFTVNPYFTLIP